MNLHKEEELKDNIQWNILEISHKELLCVRDSIFSTSYI
jgi:hypothetical protein